MCLFCQVVYFWVRLALRLLPSLLKALQLLFPWPLPGPTWHLHLKPSIMPPPHPPPPHPPVVLHLLPDLPLLAIFARLSLCKLLTIDSVSPRLGRLKAEALANRQTLTILFNGALSGQPLSVDVFNWAYPETTLPQQRQHGKQSAITVARLDVETVTWLLATFPRVSHLRIAVQDTPKGGSVLGQIALLLQQWPLEHLHLWNLDQDREHSSKVEQQLLGVLKEGLPLLQSFTLYWPNFPYDLSLCHLPCLKRLSCKHLSRQLLNLVNRNGAILRQNAFEIRLFAFHHADARAPHGSIQLATLLAVPGAVASKVTLLKVYFTLPNQKPQLRALCRAFPNLKWFNLTWRAPLHLRETFTALSPLRQLTQLELNSLTWFCNFAPVDNLSTERLPPFVNLESLSLSGCIKEHPFLSSLGPLELLFPSLKCLKVAIRILDNCLSCSGRPYTRQKEVDCLEGTVRYLVARCAPLQVEGDLFVEQTTVFRGFYTCLEYKEKVNFAPDSGTQLKDWTYKQECLTSD